jgi:mRNA interferase RelE/StbE
LPGWKLKISQSVLKDLRDLPKDDRGRSALAVLELTANPYPHGVEKLKGYDHIYRVRTGDYRIVYEIIGEEVIIIAVRHRKDVYRDLQRFSLE